MEKMKDGGKMEEEKFFGTIDFSDPMEEFREK